MQSFTNVYASDEYFSPLIYSICVRFECHFFRYLNHITARILFLFLFSHISLKIKMTKVLCEKRKLPAIFVIDVYLKSFRQSVRHNFVKDNDNLIAQSESYILAMFVRRSKLL